MKYLYGSLALFMIVNCCTFGGRRSPVEVPVEAIVINDRLGDKIDLDERDRYGLFANIDDFVSAKFYDRPEPEKGYKIVLVTQYKPYVAYNNELLTLPMLRDYIEHYDSISISREGFEEKWQIVEYDTLGLPITQAEINRAARMSLVVKASYVSCCMGFSAFAGCCIGTVLAEEDDDSWSVDPNFKWVDDAEKGMLIGATIGAVAGILVSKGVENANREKALLKIKEARKPQ